MGVLAREFISIYVTGDRKILTGFKGMHGQFIGFDLIAEFIHQPSYSSTVVLNKEWVEIGASFLNQLIPSALDRMDDLLPSPCFLRPWTTVTTLLHQSLYMTSFGRILSALRDRPIIAVLEIERALIQTWLWEFSITKSWLAEIVMPHITRNSFWTASASTYLPLLSFSQHRPLEKRNKRHYSSDKNAHGGQPQRKGEQNQPTKWLFYSVRTTREG